MVNVAEIPRRIPGTLLLSVETGGNYLIGEYLRRRAGPEIQEVCQAALQTVQEWNVTKTDELFKHALRLNELCTEKLGAVTQIDLYGGLVAASLFIINSLAIKTKENSISFGRSRIGKALPYIKSLEEDTAFRALSDAAKAFAVFGTPHLLRTIGSIQPDLNGILAVLTLAVGGPQLAMDSYRVVGKPILNNASRWFDTYQKRVRSQKLAKHREIIEKRQEMRGKIRGPIDYGELEINRTIRMAEGRRSGLGLNQTKTPVQAEIQPPEPNTHTILQDLKAQSSISLDTQPFREG